MKTITLKQTILLAFVLVTGNLYSNISNAICTRIDIRGKASNDCVWLITDPKCTHNFDNGWDGYKSLGSTSNVQLYVLEYDKKEYQIEAVDNVDGVTVAFRSGADSVYTMTFVHQNLLNAYNSLYLLDSVANKIVDITKDGTVYSFTSPVSSESVGRFKVLTNSPSGSDPIATDCNAIQNNKLSVYSSAANVFVQNQTGAEGKLKIYTALGTCVKEVVVSDGLTTLATDLSSGVYLVRVVGAGYDVITKILIP